MIKVGVLAYQGSVVEHIASLSKIEGVDPVEVRTAQELQSVSGLIIPGGESTTIGKLLNDFKLAGPLKEKIEAGLPVWGTCAGMILLAKEIVGESTSHLSVMDIQVKRNAYGSQLDSFCKKAYVPKIAPDEIPLVFIRAPWVESVGSDVEILLQEKGKIVAVEQANMLATSFHPELSDDLSFHRYFIHLIERNKK
ncbi:MAG: pyridoxal 5'-phosphate synthase glutaminase subunit PdxT [Clostridia bacterium]|nr:pyridoxal 5'-phosphate synthase glutaminase subunit PdxT [Clostridia bacterium]